MRARKNKKDVFRIGDKVKIITPKIFIRCGYPLNKQIVKDEFLNEIDVLIYEFILKTTREAPEDGRLIHFDFRDTGRIEDTKEEIKDALAFHILKKKKWGGNIRQIFEEDSPNLLNIEGTVSDKKYHKIGKRENGYYSGEDDAEPPMLLDEKTKIILTVRFKDAYSFLKINSENVIKIDEFSNGEELPF